MELPGGLRRWGPSPARGYKPEELEPIARSLEAMSNKIEREPSRRERKKILAAH